MPKSVKNIQPAKKAAPKKVAKEQDLTDLFPKDFYINHPLISRIVFGRKMRAAK